MKSISIATVFALLCTLALLFVLDFTNETNLYAGGQVPAVSETE